MILMSDLILDYLHEHEYLIESDDDFDAWMERCRTKHLLDYLASEFGIEGAA